ncbi:NADH-quinone oxidoreductase subunit NuoE [Natronosporangium hydrolyticum]|uniref:NADH-quinone oxidoreductase subunit NuoE n=1 Tax=Natronosporangium hydrolyticum TaxID=2811111 RepID=A0A895Y9B1_9ACTN|nr:NADH-quinone oxidoreductase subunit NuoE [Natronosporangium hydrolyticum]QSB14344.1 NADH-quinone oxidoreductase subunit NuoE [Natronosporangium hydrolyticum]
MTQFSEETRRRATEVIARYPAGRERSALLPLLHLVQAEQGQVTPDGIAFCAEQLGLTKAQVAAVASFYTMYKRRPTGDWLVSVCTNTMCGVLGGDRTFETLKEQLGVGHDETTPDGTITLEHAECLAACDYAPVMTVNYEFFDQTQASDALQIVGALRRGERPEPSRGAPLCTLKEMSLQLAGFADEREGALAEGSAGEPTLAGARLAERHGIAVAGFDPDTPIAPPADTPAQPGHEPPPTAKEPAADRKPAGEAPPADLQDPGKHPETAPKGKDNQRRSR